MRLLHLQDTCAELQRRMAKLQKIAACNARDNPFLSQVRRLSEEDTAHLCTKCVSGSWPAEFTCVSTTTWHYVEVTCAAPRAQAMPCVQVKAKMAAVQKELDKAHAASEHAHQAARVRVKNDSWAKF